MIALAQTHSHISLWTSTKMSMTTERSSTDTCLCLCDYCLLCHKQVKAGEISPLMAVALCLQAQLSGLTAEFTVPSQITVIQYLGFEQSLSAPVLRTSSKPLLGPPSFQRRGAWVRDFPQRKTDGLKKPKWPTGKREKLCCSFLNVPGIQEN